MSNNAFEIIRSEGYVTLKINGNLDASACNSLENTGLEKILEEPSCDVAISCEKLTELSNAGLHAFMLIQKKVKAANKQVRLISPSPEISAFILQQGANRALVSCGSLREALIQFGLLTVKTLDVNFVNPFLSATMNVLKIQAQTESTAGKMFRRDPKDKFLGDITGIIGLISDAFSGSVVISFPEATFLKIMSRMIGEDCTAMSKEIEDGAGELTNIIFGQAKVVLNEKGYGIKTAIPSVVSGKDHSVQNISRGPRVTVPFSTDVGDFFIEICLSE